MKVLFLDIDGVVNCASTAQRHRGVIGIDPLMAFRVGKIQLDTGCEVVLSSSWKHWKEGVEEVEKQVVKLYDKTPSGVTGGFTPGGEAFRGDEIKYWLHEHPEVTKYAILDDDSDFYSDQTLFRTDWNTGLTEEIARKVTDYLNE